MKRKERHLTVMGWVVGLLDTLAGKDVAKRQLQGYQVILRESTK